MIIGSTYTLKSGGIDGNKVRWASSNSKVAAVKGTKNTAKVTAKAAGKATISATYHKITVKCVVTVQKPLSISASSKVLEEGQSFTLKANGVDAEKVKWSSSDKKVATVSGNKNKATVTAKTAGSAVISATYGKASVKCTVKVKVNQEIRWINAHPLICLSPSEWTVTEGETFILYAKGPETNEYIKYTPLVSWTSSNPGVAAVGDAITYAASGPQATITAKAAGTAVITAAYEGKTATCVVTVKKAAAPVTQKITSLSDKSVFLTEGETFTIYAGSPNRNPSISWKSSDTDIATVSGTSSEAVITAKRAGTATITATCGETSLACTVTVNAAYKIKYSYALSTVFQYPIYVNTIVPVFVKTTNPNTEKDATIKFVSGPERGISYVNYPGGLSTYERYADVRYSDNNTGRTVSGGYIFLFEFTKAGTVTLAVSENGHIVNGTELRITCLSEEEYTTRLNNWADSTVSRVCTNAMTETEKMRALSTNIQNNFCYPSYQLLAEMGGARIDNKVVDCIGSAKLLCTCADRIGIKAEMNYTGYLNHYNCKAYVDGKWKTFEPQPMVYLTGQHIGVSYIPDSLDTSKVTYIM